ncbi:AraC family transcriptional regulator [Natronincola peptidivorans]|uniref:AraC family transcriptional regulator n=1 Tax=Natronincola peptidivorans TaxID=426128 RepID=A0A1I0AY62_9FIRM|nr:helix-turn-helix domain-containing protein [Natronincola peptidivorans]SES99342.1 AraC family transcriptional regulator [Natronincola peptidivorans]
MNLYVKLINEVIDYIEDNIHKKIPLEDIAKHFCVSKYHFNRMFKTVSGRTLKQYILGRKLSEALKDLNNKDISIIEAAYSFGFEYPEVFSRAFKKQFGVPPSVCKEVKLDDGIVERVVVVEREINNYKGTLTLKGSCTYLNELQLQGIFLEVDVNKEEFKTLMQSNAERFLAATKGNTGLYQERFYTVVNCHQEDNGEYTVFYGMEGKSQEESFKKRIIPQGWYVSFIYNGDMFDIRETFIDDLYRWIMVKEIELNPNGVGMLNIFEKNYLETKEVQILVPIKNQYRQQERS